MNPAQQQEVQGILNNIASLKLPALKQVARTISVAQSGRKADIQDRVKRFIQIGVDNQDFARIFAIKELVLDVINNRPAQSYEMLVRKYVAENPHGWNTGNVSHGMSLSQGASQNLLQKKPWLFFRENPFFVLKKLVTPNAGACLKAPETRGTGRVSFTLSDSDLHLLKSSRTAKLLLLCGVYDKNKSSTDAYIEFPSPIEIHFNDVQVKDNVKGIKNKPGTTKPADLTPYVRSNNTLQIVYAFTKVDYLVFCYIVEEIPPERILAKVLANPRTLKQTTLDTFKAAEDNDDDEDEIMEMGTRLSLKCPLSFQRMKYPVKSIYCSHLPCFDALSFIYLQEQAATWACPLCNSPVKVKDLSVNEYVSDILKNTPEECDTVEIELDGSWTPLFEDADGHYHKGKSQTAGLNSAGSAVVSPTTEPLGDDLTASKTEPTSFNSTDITPNGESPPLDRSKSVVPVVSPPKKSAAEPVVISLDSDDEDFDAGLIELSHSASQVTEPAQTTQQNSHTSTSCDAEQRPHTSEVPNSDSPIPSTTPLPITSNVTNGSYVSPSSMHSVHSGSLHPDPSSSTTDVPLRLPATTNSTVLPAPHAANSPSSSLIKPLTVPSTLQTDHVLPKPSTPQVTVQKTPAQLATWQASQPVHHVPGIQESHITHNPPVPYQTAHYRAIPPSLTSTSQSTSQSMNGTTQTLNEPVRNTPSAELTGTSNLIQQAPDSQQTDQPRPDTNATQQSLNTEIKPQLPAISHVNNPLQGALTVASYDQEINEIASLSKRLQEINQLQQSRNRTEHSLPPLVSGPIRSSGSTHGSPPVPPPHLVNHPAPSSFIPHVSQSSLLSGRQLPRPSPPALPPYKPVDVSGQTVLPVQSPPLPAEPSSSSTRPTSALIANQKPLPPVIPKKRVLSNPNVTTAQSELKNSLDAYSEKSGIARANTIHNIQPSGSYNALSYIQSLNSNIQKSNSNSAATPPVLLAPSEGSIAQPPSQNFSPSRFADPQRQTSGSPPSTTSSPPPVVPSGKNLLGIKTPAGPSANTKHITKTPNIFISSRRPHAILERKRLSTEPYQQPPKKQTGEAPHDDVDDIPLMHR